MKKIRAVPILISIITLMHTSFSLCGGSLSKELRKTHKRPIARPFGSEKPITLPSVDVLQIRIEKVAIPHFMQHSNLAQELAERTILPAGVFLAVDFALQDYAKHAQSRTMANLANETKLSIIRAILQDYPEATRDAEALVAKLVAVEVQDEFKLQTEDSEITIILPSADILQRQILDKVNVAHLLQVTKLHLALTEIALSPSMIVLGVDYALDEYTDHHPRFTSILIGLRPHIIRAILQDYPEAIRELEERGKLKQQATDS